MIWTLHNGATAEHLGFIPLFLVEGAGPAKEQIDRNYQHGGGWRKFEGFELLENDDIQYPGDPVEFKIGSCQLGHEKIVVYRSAWVAIIQPDRSYEIARID